MTPMGLIGLMGPMGPMGLIGLIGPMGWAYWPLIIKKEEAETAFSAVPGPFYSRVINC